MQKIILTYQVVDEIVIFPCQVVHVANIILTCQTVIVSIILTCQAVNIANTLNMPGC